jgi:hypothetical protein
MSSGRRARPARAPRRRSGDLVSKVSPEIDGTILPSMMCPMPSALQFGKQRRRAVAIGLEHVR